MMALNKTKFLLKFLHVEGFYVEVWGKTMSTGPKALREKNAGRFF